MADIFNLSNNLIMFLEFQVGVLEAVNAFLKIYKFLIYYKTDQSYIDGFPLSQYKNLIIV